MSIKVNGTDIGSSIKLNNIDLSEIVFNGVSVWKNLPASLEAATWDEIKTAIQNGTFTQFASVGDTKTFQINNKTYTAEVVAINTGFGSAAEWYPDKTVDFITKELYTTTYQYNTTVKNNGGFPSSKIKNTLNNTLYPLLPTDLKSVIIDKSHSYQAGSYSTITNKWSSSMTTLATKLWLPTTYEIAGGVNTYAPDETSSNNKKYTLSSIIKSRNGSNDNWWLGSPYTSYERVFWKVSSYGVMNYADADASIGVPICFRIG